MILKQVKHYPETNSVEATWVDENDAQVRCHSYADVQMDMLIADLGDDATAYADLIAEVTCNIKSVEPEPIVIPQVITMRQAKLVLLAAGLLDDVDAVVANADRAAQIEWEYAAEISRTWPALITLQAVLGMSDEQVDSLFLTGSTM